MLYRCIAHFNRQNVSAPIFRRFNDMALKRRATGNGQSIDRPVKVKNSTPKWGGMRPTAEEWGDYTPVYIILTPKKYFVKFKDSES